MALTQFNAVGGLGIGTAGTAVIDSAGKPVVSTGLGYKNMIINGDFMIDQRNAAPNVRSSTGVTSAAANYPADKWVFLGTSAAVITATRSYDGTPFPQNSYLRMQVTTASTTYTALSMVNRLEGFTTNRLLYGTASAKTSAISFWARSSLTGKFSFSITNSAQDRSYVSSFTITAANTWQKFTYKIAGDTTGTWLYDSNIGATFRINLQNVVGGNAATPDVWAAGNFFNQADTLQFGGTLNSTLDITAVQWETGEVATDFDQRTYQEELNLCRRYCYVHAVESVTTLVWGGMIGLYTSATAGNIYFQFPNELRAAPTMTVPLGIARIGVTSWAPSNVTSASTAFSIIAGGTTNKFVQFAFTAGTGRTVGTFCQITTPAANNNFRIVLSADL